MHIALAVILTALFWGAAFAEEFVGQVVGVIDGDTIDVLHNGQAERIRLNGIDTPEKGQDYGRRAKQFAEDLLAKRAAWIKFGSSEEIVDLLRPKPYSRASLVRRDFSIICSRWLEGRPRIHAASTRPWISKRRRPPNDGWIACPPPNHFPRFKVEPACISPRSDGSDGFLFSPLPECAPIGLGFA